MRVILYVAFPIAAFLLIAGVGKIGQAEDLSNRDFSLTVTDNDIVVEINGSVRYSPHIRLGEGCVGFEVDESRLDLQNAGEYTVYVVAIGADGRRGERMPLKVRVLDNFDAKWLDRTLDELVCDLDASGKSAERICRDIYRLVRDKLFYSCEAEREELSRAAFYALKTGSGDCFSYAALTKLLLDRCGIENVLVERARGSTPDTHYWNMVNIGDYENAKWYHLDTTELRFDEYSHSGCLLTDRQIDAYSLVRENFYRYERSQYPTAAEEIITPTPHLDRLLPRFERESYAKDKYS